MILSTPALFALVTFSFLIFYLVPVDPAVAWAGPFADGATIEAVRERFHLNDPVHIQYFEYLTRLIQGDLGRSPITGHPVLQDLAIYFPLTMELVLFSTVLSVTFGLFLGIVSALKRNKVQDHVARVFALFGTASPRFWTALLAQIFFYSYLGLFPAIGIAQPGTDIPRVTGMPVFDSLITLNFPALYDTFHHLLIPASVLALPQISILSRLVRGSVLEVLGQDYVRTARAKGLPNRLIVYKHVLRNALLPVTTQIGMMIGWQLGGSVIVETIFSRAGMGSYVATAALEGFDIPALAGVTLVMGSIFIIANLIVDILYASIDPRIKVGAK